MTNVFSGMTRRRVLVVVAAAAGAGLAARPAHAGTTASPVFPRPGGGPAAIHAYQDPLGERPRTWLLDSVSGRYRELEFQAIAVSPSGLQIAVVLDDGADVPRVGVAGRLEFQRRGAAAVRWLTQPNSGVVTFSPDGKAVMTYSVDKGETGISFTAHRYDLATGNTRGTVMTGSLPPQWAADSRRYLAGGLEGLRHVNPDGSLGSSFTAEGGIIRQYSPCGDKVVIDPPLPFPDGEPAPWKIAKVVDVATGDIISRIPAAAPDLGVPTSAPLLGWRGNGHVVRYAPAAPATTIEVVDVLSGAVTRRVPAPGLHPMSYAELRTTGHLWPAAYRAGL